MAFDMVWPTAWRFALLGPLLGGLGWMVIWLSAMLASPGAVRLTGGMALALLGFTYALGVVPAAVTGALAGLWRARLSRMAWCGLSGVLGMAVSTLMFVALVLPGDAAGSWRRVGEFAQVMGLPGLLGGVLSAWWVSRPGATHPHLA